jgi:hypothetical protein
VFPGGADVDPAEYGETREPKTEVVTELDRLELAVAEWAIHSDMPTLGICRGQQLLNVAMGGSLIQHLAGHRQPGGLRLPWHEIQWALRRLEDRGLVRGGRFVGGFSGEQYAQPGAVEQLARLRRAPRTQECVVLNATDPLNLVGLIVPAETVPAVRTNHVAYVDGLPGDRAATARMAPRLEGERIGPAVGAAALPTRRGR